MKRIIALTVTVGLSLSVGAGVAHAKTPPRPTVTVMPTESVQIDKQATANVVTVIGVAKNSAVTVTWGDGSVERLRSNCTTKKAATKPARCAVSTNHYYLQPNVYDVTVKAGASTLASTSVMVKQQSVPWSAPEGWVQPAGWSIQNGGATYAPCSTVYWYWNHDGEPESRNGLYTLVPQALTVLAQETGLTFVETTDPEQANMTFSWSDLPNYPNAAGSGGGNFRTMTSTVTFNRNNWWTANEWNGFTKIQQPNGLISNGNGALIIHEVLHALGLGHVDDDTQIMNPVTKRPDLGAGDLDGLHTLYLNQPCVA